MTGGGHSHLKAAVGARDTIVGMSGAPGGALSLLRISGPGAVAAAQRIFRGKLRSARRPVLGHLIDAERGSPIDEALATWYPAPRTYTREDLVEITLRGSPALADRVVHQALRAGARLAAPGEFTRRAMLHGRIDLLEAAGVLAMMTATGPQELAAAADLVEGRASGRLRAVEAGIHHALHQLEGASDDPREENPDASVEDVATGLRGVADTLAGLARAPLSEGPVTSAAITSATRQVQRAIDAVDDGLAADAVMEALLAARAAVGRLSGRTASPEDLDAFFARFPPGS